jgi:hypothetical protein
MRDEWMPVTEAIPANDKWKLISVSWLHKNPTSGILSRERAVTPGRYKNGRWEVSLSMLRIYGEWELGVEFKGDITAWRDPPKPYVEYLYG